MTAGLRSCCLPGRDPQGDGPDGPHAQHPCDGLPIAAVARLVASSWLGADPVSAPHWRQLLHDMASEIDQIARYSTDDAIRPDDEENGSMTATRQEKKKGVIPRLPDWDPWRLRTLIALGLAVVLAVGGTAAAVRLGQHHPTPAAPPCQACVTYGRPAFDRGSPAMRSAETAIWNENGVVTRSGKPYVTIALLIPLTNGLASDASLSRMVDQLRGAYLAQIAMNAQDILGVQLLLANEGTSAELAAGPAVRQLETMEGAPAHLVAVAGLGLSIDRTAQAANALAADHMPMFGAVMSADELNGTRFRGLDQLVPDNGAQVAALAAALPAPRRGVLVYDQQATDLYTANLKADLTRAFSRSLTDQAEPFTPGVRDTNLEFKIIADEVCYTAGPAPVVFFAGRATVMSSLISKFQGDGNCQGKKITMVTGGDGDGLAPQVTSPSAGSGQVRVIYSGIFDLGKVAAAFTKSYRKQLASVDPKAAGLGDTWTLGTYNAMEAAWAAVQLGYEASRPALPEKADVLEMSVRLNGEYAPLGATGRFSIGADGRLMSPDIPIFEDAGGTRTTLRS